MTGVTWDKQVSWGVVEISSTFELVNLEIPARFPSGDSKETVGFTRLELRGEVSVEMHSWKS